MAEESAAEGIRAQGRRGLDLMAVETGLITEDQRQEALAEQKRSGRPFHEVLRTRYAVDQEALTHLLVEEAGIRKIDPDEVLTDPEILKLIPARFALDRKVLPLAREGARLTVAMADPFDLPTMEEMQRITRCYIDAQYVPPARLIPLIERFYETGERDYRLGRGEKAAGVAVAAGEGVGGRVIGVVDELIALAITEGATDIHLEPTEKNLSCRLRVDGLLHPGPVMAKVFQAPVTTRIKVMANLNISESRLPQDGSIRHALNGKSYDLRVSTFPTIHGEAVVLRILDKEKLVLGLGELGLSSRNLVLFRQAIDRPNGIILVTGPTGSGKTTTLYSSLSTINSGERNIMTLEDPVEYELEGIRQSQINIQAGLTFAAGLRSMLRQDPDVMLVGEVRDGETMEIAIRASLSGHLVFTTLHTNDAVGAVPRLLDMGVEPYLLASSLALSMGQRLIRVICKSCKEKYQPEKSQLSALGLEEKETFFRGRGCGRCFKTGYKGRIGIFEVLSISGPVREFIMARADSNSIKQQALKEGLVTMMDDGRDKVRRGLTTVEEVIRVAHTI